jgi:hypothetical protein
MRGYQCAQSISKRKGADAQGPWLKRPWRTIPGRALVERLICPHRIGTPDTQPHATTGAAAVRARCWRTAAGGPGRALRALVDRAVLLEDRALRLEQHERGRRVRLEQRAHARAAARDHLTSGAPTHRARARAAGMPVGRRRPTDAEAAAAGGGARSPRRGCRWRGRSRQSRRAAQGSSR